MYRSLSGSVLLLSLASVVLIGCDRSDGVGWADRERPAEAGSVDTTATAVEATTPDSDYEQLGELLNPIMRRAMEDGELGDRYQELIAEIEDAIAEKSAFYRGLMDREEEIEARFAEAEETGEPIPEATRDTLLYHYRNINYEIWRRVDYELQAGEFKDEFWEFKLELFARMRELAPERAEDIDRLQQLERDRPVDIAPPLQENIQITPAAPPEG
jgi:hypothetical protein